MVTVVATQMLGMYLSLTVRRSLLNSPSHRLLDSSPIVCQRHSFTCFLHCKHAVYTRVCILLYIYIAYAVQNASNYSIFPEPLDCFSLVIISPITVAIVNT